MILGVSKTTLLLTTTNTTITITWTLPSFVPQTYRGYRQCRGLCEQSFSIILSDSSISSPHTFTGIDPGTYCIVGLNGIYGSDQYGLGTRITNTLSSGKLYYILILKIIILFSHYLQHPLHLSVISLFHYLKEGP